MTDLNELERIIKEIIKPNNELNAVIYTPENNNYFSIIEREDYLINKINSVIIMDNLDINAEIKEILKFQVFNVDLGGSERMKKLKPLYHLAMAMYNEIKKENKDYNILSLTTIDKTKN